MQFDRSVFQGFESNKEPKKIRFRPNFSILRDFRYGSSATPPLFFNNRFFTLTLKISGIIINFSFASVGNVL